MELLDDFKYQHEQIEEHTETRSLMEQCIDACNPSTQYEKDACKLACYQTKYYGGDKALQNYINEQNE